MAAVQLAIKLVSSTTAVPPADYRKFSEFALAHALPTETRVILKTLHARGIPYLQLEHEPLAGNLDIGFRVRRNGLISAGHGVNSRVLDGTFCQSRAGKECRALLRDPAARRALLERMGVARARDAAGIEAEGGLYCLLVINHQLRVIARQKDGGSQLVRDAHDSLAGMALGLSAMLGSAPIAIELRTKDIHRPLAFASGGVVDFDLAPNLHEILNDCQQGNELVDVAVGELLDWLFPRPEDSRIPIAAVTGTNGKTSTCRMIDHILRCAGYRPGLVCTDGIFLDGRPVSKGDGSAFIGHARVLSSKAVDAAVLESHHRGIAVRGFAYQQCNVAACLNVTNDHLVEGEIETVEEMAGIKRALLERATDGVVLNADDHHCLGMLPQLAPRRVSLFSSHQGRADLAPYEREEVVLWLLEERHGQEWVVVHDRLDTVELLPVAAMPCTFGGAARFCLENALAAMASCYLLGVALADIRRAMQLFTMGHEQTPGRLNRYDQLPFTAVIDYAHNPDGIARLAEFARRLPVAGRRLLLLAAPGDRSEEIIGDMARAAAGNFDHYVCRSYPNTRGRAPDEIPEVLRSALLQAGVPSQAVTIEPGAEAATDRILGMAAPHDLVILQLSSREFEAMHAHLLALRSGNRAA
jgi:cyanophycin synthetase